MSYKILVDYSLSNENTIYATMMVTAADPNLPKSVLHFDTNSGSFIHKPELYLGPFDTPEAAKAAVKPVIEHAIKLIERLRDRKIPRIEVIEV